MFSEDNDFIKTFLYSFGHKFLKDVLLFEVGLQSFKLFWPGVETQNVSFILSLKDNTEYMYFLNQHWIDKHSMQCWPNRLIHINAFS